MFSGYAYHGSTRTINNYQKHVEGETNVVLVVEGEKLHVIKEVSRSTEFIYQYTE